MRPYFVNQVPIWAGRVTPTPGVSMGGDYYNTDYSTSIKLLSAQTVKEFAIMENFRRKIHSASLTTTEFL
jgi:hypothetical protein